MFTGGGKTVVFAHIINDFLLQGHRAIVLAHRNELIWQAKETISKVCGVHVDVEMGEHKVTMQRDMFHPVANVVVSTVQTQTSGGDGGGRIGKFDPMDYRCLIIDECHRAVSASYRRVMQYFLTNPKLVILGVTATPDRADEKALGQVFEIVPDAFDYDMNYGRVNGWLAEIDQQMISIDGLDFDKVRSNSEDLNSAELSAVMMSERPFYGMVDATLREAGDRKGIGFSPSVDHAKKTCDIFNRYRPGCAAFIHGGTEPGERKAINDAFKQGTIRWIWNCGTHTEGFDDPTVEVIVPKPTKSRALYEQMIGRGSRPHPSIVERLNNTPVPALRRQLIARSAKPNFLVIDFHGNAGKHKLITAFDILGGDMSFEAVEKSIEFAKRTGKPVRVATSLAEEEKRQTELKLKRELEAATKAKIVVRANYKKTKVDPFDLLDIKPVAKRGWHESQILSPKQRNVLLKCGFNPDEMEYHRGKQLVGIICERWANNKCSFAQIKTLAKFGYKDGETKDWSKDRASKTIDAIAKNGWKRPSGFIYHEPGDDPGTSGSREETQEAVPAGDVDNDDVPF